MKGINIKDVETCVNCNNPFFYQLKKCGTKICIMCKENFENIGVDNER
jgi:hypothetical protein